MQFSNPLFLFGIMAIVIPIAIHLFNFRRYKTEYFSNVKLLQEILLQTKRESQLLHLLVLFLRILGIAAVAFAFAQPFLPNENFQSQKGTTVSVFVDNSFSMEANTQQTSFLNEAKDAAHKIADAFSYNDDFLLFTNYFNVQESQFINKDELTTRLDEINISPKSKSLSQILHFEKRGLTNSKKSQKISYYISDFQKSQFDFTPLLKDTIQTTYLVPIESKHINNVSIDSCWFDRPVFKEGYQVGLTVRISNYCKEEVVKLPVKLYINNEQRALGAVDIKPNSYADYTLFYTLQKAGTQCGTVEIYDTPITFDDKFYFVTEIAATTSVITIQDKVKNKYLNALYGSDSLFIYETMSVNQVNYAAFVTAQLIVMDQVETISTGLAAELEKYVKSGGTMLVFPAEKMNVTTWGSLFTALNIPNYKEITPQQIKVGEINKESVYFKTALQKTKEDAWEMPTVTNYYTFENKNVPSEMVMQLENRSPFLTSYSVEKGKVILSAVALNDYYGNAHRNAIFFVPLHNLAIISQIQSQLYYIVGENNTITISQTAAGSEDIFTLKSRDNHTELIPEQRNSGNESYLFAHSQIEQAGFYEVIKAGNVITAIAFNFPRSESNLEYYSENELENISSESNGRIKLIASSTKNLTQTISASLSGIELWRFFLLFALSCFLTEILLLRFWGKAKVHKQA